MAIFNGYVSLPEGTIIRKIDVLWNCIKIDYQFEKTIENRCLMMFEGWFFCSRTRRVDHCTSESARVSFLLFVSHLATLQNHLVWSRPLCQCDHKVVSALWEEYHPNIFKLYPLNEQNHISISFIYICYFVYIYRLYIYIYIY